MLSTPKSIIKASSYITVLSLIYCMVTQIHYLFYLVKVGKFYEDEAKQPRNNPL